MSHWSMARNIKPQGDNCVWKENITAGCIDRNWHEGSEVAIWFLVGLGKTQLKCCIQVGIFGLTWEAREDNKTNKKQLRNYCVKENFNSERVMWRNRDFIPQQKVLVDYSHAAVLENTCRAWPRWCGNVVWCHLGWADAAAALLCIAQTAEVARSLQLRVWVTGVMHSASREFGDGLLCLTPFSFWHLSI